MLDISNEYGISLKRPSILKTLQVRWYKALAIALTIFLFNSIPMGYVLCDIFPDQTEFWTVSCPTTAIMYSASQLAFALIVLRFNEKRMRRLFKRSCLNKEGSRTNWLVELRSRLNSSGTRGSRSLFVHIMGWCCCIYALFSNDHGGKKNPTCPVGPKI